MKGPLNLFSREEATRLRDEAIEQVGRRLSWKEIAIEAIETLAMSNHTFNSDDVLRLRPELENCHERRVLGAAFRIVSSRGLIEPTGRFVDSIRVKSHRRPKREWRRK